MLNYHILKSNAMSDNSTKDATQTLDLTVAERLVLRGTAHALKPTVMIGKTGVTPAIVAETERALTAHQLIKVKLLSDDREERAAHSAALCAALECHRVQTIGKILVLFKDDGNYVPPAPGVANAAPKTKKRAKNAPHVAKKKLASQT